MGLFTPAIRQYLKDVAGRTRGRLLDVGCGETPYRDLFTGVTTYIGVDRPSTVDATRPNMNGRSRAIDVEGSADAFPFAAGTFDAVLATQLIEDLAQPEVFFAEAARVLRPGGSLILTFPHVNPVHEAPYDFFRYTEFGVRQLCRSHGLQVTETKPMGGGWGMIGYMVRHMLWQDATDPARGRLARARAWHLGQFIHRICSRLDRRGAHPECTLNYLVVARREGTLDAGR